MSKKYVSVNTKYYKHSNASGEMGHVDRLFAENKNALPEHTHKNFGSQNALLSRYNELHERRVRESGKNVRKDATTFVDSVVVFSLDRWEELEGKHGSEKLQRAMSKMMDDYLQEMKQTYGLEPVGFKFHLDEGHVKNGLKRNIHAHAIFYNYDFEKKISPWRSLKKRDFSNFQDIAAKAFKRAGFERGISKENTKKKHLEKDAFVDNKQAALAAIIEKQKTDILRLNSEKKELESDILETRKSFVKWIKSILRKAYKQAARFAPDIAQDLTKMAEKQPKVVRNIVYDYESIEQQQKVPEDAKVSNKVIFSNKHSKPSKS